MLLIWLGSESLLYDLWMLLIWLVSQTLLYDHYFLSPFSCQYEDLRMVWRVCAVVYFRNWVLCDKMDTLLVSYGTCAEELAVFSCELLVGSYLQMRYANLWTVFFGKIVAEHAACVCVCVFFIQCWISLECWIHLIACNHFFCLNNYQIFVFTMAGHR